MGCSNFKLRSSAYVSLESESEAYKKEKSVLWEGNLWYIFCLLLLLCCVYGDANSVLYDSVIGIHSELQWMCTTRRGSEEGPPQFEREERMYNDA